MDYSEFLPVPALAMKKLSYPNLRQLGRILIGAPDFCQCFFPEMERARKIPRKNYMSYKCGAIGFVDFPRWLASNHG